MTYNTSKKLNYLTRVRIATDEKQIYDVYMVLSAIK